MPGVARGIKKLDFPHGTLLICVTSKKLSRFGSAVGQRWLTYICIFALYNIYVHCTYICDSYLFAFDIKQIVLQYLE